ncbi:PKD repeat-containing protein [Blastococcus aurantiacus]|uniref:PKD repeat-containing protein n=1 Tax=Blastococcus aurantiacus TaxID=1550231 RepID=A0A1G7JQ65_9ACTN|nr:PKD domain-containing protein [Blastococcus aurantiacus]SDF27016.1 PKD repeat-containing protein [Blastococcus aurantiacus]
MTGSTAPASRRVLAGVLSTLLAAGSLSLLVSPARADTAPVAATTPTTVSADALPTVQINGVAWSQVVVGNTVYVAGSFTSARPAGAPAGVSETPRNNLLAYDIRTGELVRSFAPSLNGQALVITASPDGKRLYVGGDFDKVDGQTRYRIAAIDTATGALVPNWGPGVNGRVRAIVATDSTVYFGGNVQAVGSHTRNRLAAVSASNGALLPWAPVPGVGSTKGNRDGSTKTSNEVLAMVRTAGDQIVVAGRFDSLNGTKATGVGALDPVSGATRPFAINQLITNQGVNSAIYSLSTDGSTVYGTAYDYNGPGNIEGSFAAAADGGAIRWINDCRGDTYSSFATGGALYMAGHPHDCANIGGFPEQSPRVNKFATAVSLEPAGVVGSKTLTNSNFAGKPAPALQNWFPTMSPGTFTGQAQAGWTVTGNDSYVVYGGEFPQVNGVGQQGLVRYARPDIAPNKVGPYTFASAPTVTSPAPGQARISWTTTNDRDNSQLTYAVYREGEALPVAESVNASTWWENSQLTATDVGVSGSLRYRVTATDPFGNTVGSDWVPVQVAPATTGTVPYADRVRADGAQSHWRLGDRSGNAVDAIGSRPMTVGNGVTRGVAGAVPGDADTAYSFAGTAKATMATQTATAAPNVFTVEAWFQTSSATGGRLLGFANSQSGTSSKYDRQVYLDAQGRLNFSVNAPVMFWTTQRTVTSIATFNDGKWHHVAASMGANGMALYVDGTLVGSRTDTKSGESYNGYLRVGSDRAMGGSNTFSGRIDEVAYYPKALTAAQVMGHVSGAPVNQVPAARFSSTTTYLTADLDASRSVDAEGPIASYAWTLGDGTTATGRTVSHTYGAGGTYVVGLTVTDAAGATSTSSRLVQVSPEPPNQAPTAAFTSSVADLRVDVDGAGSADADGSVVSHDWDFGDGSTGTGATASHDYTAAGTYTVRLTVTDDDGATATAEREVTVTAPRVNQAPTAAFTSTATDLSVVVDGAASADPDGTVSSYAWDFGDGTTATGATASHAYTAGGTYTVRLTVTDDDGATAVVERAVLVGAPPLAMDAFEREVASGFGVAQVGGAWTLSGGAASVSGGVGHLDVATGGASAAALLNSVQARDVAVQAGLSLDRAPTGGGSFVYLMARRTAGNNVYRVSVRFQADGKVVMALLRTAAGTETALKTITLPGTYTPGTVLQVRFDVTGAETPTLQAKAWTSGTVEPTGWQLSATDTGANAALQGAGGIGVSVYVAGSATAPVRVNVDDLWAGAAGTAPIAR